MTTDQLCTCGHTRNAHTHNLDPMPCDAIVPTKPPYGRAQHWTACPCERFTPARSAYIVGGVGLGTCSACNAPGAYWYPCVAADLAWLGPGVWMCDSCQWPAVAHARIQADLAIIRRNGIGIPTARRS